MVSFERIEWNLLNFAIFFGLDDGETIVAFGNLFEVKIICFFFFFFFLFNFLGSNFLILRRKEKFVRYLSE